MPKKLRWLPKLLRRLKRACSLCGRDHYIAGSNLCADCEFALNSRRAA